MGQPLAAPRQIRANRGPPIGESMAASKKAPAKAKATVRAAKPKETTVPEAAAAPAQQGGPGAKAGSVVVWALSLVLVTFGLVALGIAFYLYATARGSDAVTELPLAIAGPLLYGGAASAAGGTIALSIDTLGRRLASS